MQYPTVANILLIDMDTEEKFNFPVTMKMVILNQVFAVKNLREKLEHQARETSAEKKLYHGMSISLTCSEYILRMLLKARRLEMNARRRKC